MRELTLAVVGIDFPNADGSNRRSEAMMTLPGAPVSLVPEPKNRHDPNAVAVIGPHGVQLGYINAERAPHIAARLRRDEEIAAIFQGMANGAAFVRVRFGGGIPTLPPDKRPSGPAGLADGPPDGPPPFYPDDDGPEWGA